jgi:hypothetical protein
MAEERRGILVVAQHSKRTLPKKVPPLLNNEGIIASALDNTIDRTSFSLLPKGGVGGISAKRGEFQASSNVDEFLSARILFSMLNLDLENNDDQCCSDQYI